MSPRLLAYGDRALLAEFDDITEVIDWADALRAAALDTVAEVVPAARTVLVVAAPGVDTGILGRQLRDVRPVESVRQASEPRTVEIPVRYDGPDLADVAELTGIGEDDVVRAHTGTPWRVAFGGFAPGFAYLSGGDSSLRVARRDEPRTKVPAGAVGLAGEFSAVYPNASPGGWRLIGTTQKVMWDLDRNPPALLEPGCVVHFVDEA